MSMLGKKWCDIQLELAERNIEFTWEVTYPTGRVTPCGDLRIVRVSYSADEELHFILVHDRFKKE